MNWSRLSGLIVIAGALLTTSCGESREARVERISNAACDRFEQCGNLDEYDYESYNECRADMDSNFYDSWPADQCNEGQINREAYRDCLDRARNFPCDANLFDFLSFVSDCNAEQVCTDPP